MKKFYFKLQKILDIREKLELEQKNKLAFAAAEYQKLIQKKEEAIAKTIISKKNIYEKIKTNTVSIEQLHLMDTLQKNIDQFSRSLQPEIVKTKKIMEQEKRIYDKLKKEHQIIESLKEKSLKNYQLYRNKSELDELDEIGKNHFPKL